MAKGLSLARAFYLSGHRVIGADFETNNAPCSGRFSRSLSAFYRLPKPNAKEGDKAYIESLTQIINDEKVNLWVSCSGVASAVEDAQAKETIEQNTKCKCVQFDVQTTSKLHEKGSFMDECKRIGLPVPETHEVRSQRDVLRILSKAKPKQKFILKPVGMDDRNRGNMTLLPLSSEAKTQEHVSQLPISKATPWILQQFVAGGEEYCTHALVVRGEVKCFAACGSAELLMHYSGLAPRESALWKSMLAFTAEFVDKSPRPEALTGHLSFDFMAAEGTPSQNGFAKNIYAIECNPRAHTAVVLFATPGPDMDAMVRAYLSALEPAGKGTAGALVDGAKHLPHQPALGFADYTSKHPSQWPPDQVTFSELCNLSKRAAVVVAGPLHQPDKDIEQLTVGLLCTSSLKFVLTWLGLMHAGYKVLLLAPQLDSGAIKHLCETSDIRTILVDEAQRQRDLQLSKSVDIVDIPSFRDDGSAGHDGFQEGTREESNIAYLRHTSGTSSGLPKQIVQTQWGATGCLPSFPRTDQTPATFSTTPLYHGGLADCFRAWTSGAMIWFFPEGVVPITGSNVVRSISYARNQSATPVKYFSSVPYVLQLLADEPEGIDYLRSMDLVGVGGAALAPSVGDKLVGQGVNLVSRMGSSECGFLMSSHRDYAKDKEWQYLRPIVDPKYISFEPRDNGLCELVVKPCWPLTSKTNRADGSYATADLFESHPSIPNAWRYHSRADAQITLANGKKFDPSPLEESIKASNRLVRDVLVFGAGRDYPGALLFKTSNDILDHEFIDSIWPYITQLNTNSSSHTRLSKSMLVALDSKDEEPLAKSSKGTILRRQAESRYADIIDQAYAGKAALSENAHIISDDDLPAALIKLFNQVLGHDIDPNQDFFQQGVDSIACIQIRKLIESSMLSSEFPRLPLNIIYDSGNVNSLANNLTGMRRGVDIFSPYTDEALIPKLILKYSNFPKFTPGDRIPDAEVVLLTGATGSLGAHILSKIVSLPQVKMVYCLVRASTAEEAESRVVSSLKSRRIFRPAAAAKATCLPGDLSQESLGLDDLTLEVVRANVTTIIHSAWMVNFNVNLGSFEQSHIRGVHNMIKLCLGVLHQTPAKLFFISSVAAAAGAPTPSTIKEAQIEDLHHLPSTGYARSKLVAEHILRAAAKSTGMHATVLRTGQLIGDVDNGIWNPTEAIPLMVQSASTVEALPALDETPSWLPVDKCASAVLELAGLNSNGEERLPKSQAVVYHVMNTKTFSWSKDLLPALEEAGLRFEALPPSEWVQRLRASEQDAQKNPTIKLLDFYTEKYLSGKNRSICHEFETVVTERDSETIRQGFDIVQGGIMKKCLDYWRLEWAGQR
ncbi:hypothetical protein GGR52DRAFT_589636 [Hypoxylon sp. FL1284]|nr:hypothetical protein GGR52DRAFT_589636 [Hypoxylon sp. FL1284]